MSTNEIRTHCDIGRETLVKHFVVHVEGRQQQEDD